MNPNLLRSTANGLTIGRALLGLPMVIALGQGQASLAWILLLVGGLSDWADGWLARRAGGGSIWGAQLDPLTDKIFLLAPLLWLTQQQRLPLWALWLLISRELLISSWRGGQASGGAASMTGKAKTLLQFAALLLMLWPQKWLPPQVVSTIHGLGWCLFWPSLLLALYSALGYLKPKSN
ncbi:MAG: CDP-alcohol phosphatidyltransferase family protein [Synechococcus sp. SupBloom_Metag_053]|nr:CDP-alcohol phosphatidyltransferase family protein [Synechococcus sp. SupBloom_Metag_053]